MQKPLIFILVFILGFNIMCPRSIIAASGSAEENYNFYTEEYPIYFLKEPKQKNDEIAEIQKVLQRFGFYQGEIDGIYGLQTVSAVNSFRQTVGLSQSGIVDLPFYQALSEVYEKELLQVREEICLSSGETFIVIVLSELTLYVLEEGAVKAKFPIAIGKPSTPSPMGEWRIISRGAKKASQFGTRWLGLNVPWGVYGIHGTNRPYSIGTMASAGCIRMFNRDVENLYPITKEGMLVFIINEPFGVFGRGLKTLKIGDTGSDVLYIQRRLRQIGFFDKEPNGLFDWWTHQALVAYQKSKGLPSDGVLEPHSWQELGLFPFE